MILIGGVAAGPALSIDSYLPAFPAIAKEFGASPSAVQLTLTTFFVGMILGMVVAGPLSDRFGRKPPLVIGLAMLSLASLACALAPSVEFMIGARFVQGAAAATGMALQAAVVRDIAHGARASRLLASLMLVTMAAPIIAPLIGSNFLLLGSWRWIFVALAAYGAIWCGLVSVCIHETLPPERQRRGSLAKHLREYKVLVRDRSLLAVGLAAGLVSGAFYVYLSGSSPVLQGVYGVSPQAYGVLFAINAIGVALAAQSNRLILRRRSVEQAMKLGLAVAAIAGASLVAAIAIGGLGLLGVLIPLFVIVGACGQIYPNAIALGMAGHPDLAGGASSLLSLMQIGLGAALAPLAGIGGARSALPMAIAIGALAISAPIVFRIVGGSNERRIAGP
ncbi:MAG TPA: multidrug effflux MFS transporter [Baekduia sp.]|nr:multidrug effflux MFS transporter [Baekduia sp.]